MTQTNALSSISTRLAELADLDAIAALFDAYRQFYEQEADLTLARQFIAARLQNQQSIILLAFDASAQSIGFCQLYPSFCSVEAKPIYTLYDLFVSPAARRSGAGQALLLAAHELAATAGIARLDLSTAKSNLLAQKLYESVGWIKDEVFLTYNKRVDSCVKQP